MPTRICRLATSPTPRLNLRVIASRRHRRIVVCSHLDTLGSAHSLLWAVSTRKNDTQSFFLVYPTSHARRSIAEAARRKPRLHNQKEKPPYWVVSFCARAIKKIFSAFCLRDLNLTDRNISDDQIRPGKVRH